MTSTANKEQLKNDLTTWEERYRGHMACFDDDLREIEGFANDPMFDNLTDLERETIKMNLVDFLTQVI